jgi:hypothetical protein
LATLAVAGCDPGSKGAIALIYPDDGWLRVIDMPTYEVTRTKTKTVIDEGAICRFLKAGAPVHLYLEEVASSPQMGVASAFTFGINYGTIKALATALEIPRSEVRPQVWKKDLRVPRDKKEATGRARELFPGAATLFTRPDRAEASLICLYGLLHLGHSIRKRLEPFPEHLTDA